MWFERVSGLIARGWELLAFAHVHDYEDRSAEYEDEYAYEYCFAEYEYADRFAA